MQQRKSVLCPIHKVPMRSAKIEWGFIAEPLEVEKYKEIIYGGCCMPQDKNGNTPRYGYICTECEKLLRKEDNDINYTYMLIDGEIVPID